MEVRRTDFCWPLYSITNQNMHIFRSVWAVRIQSHNYNSVSRINRAITREDNLLNTSGSTLAERPGKTGRSSWITRGTFIPCGSREDRLPWCFCRRKDNLPNKFSLQTIHFRYFFFTFFSFHFSVHASLRISKPALITFSAIKAKTNR